MPGFDKSGPQGQGSMTGRKIGRCTNFGQPNSKEETSQNSNNEQFREPDQVGFGQGMRRGMQGGRGRGRGFGRRGGF